MPPINSITLVLCYAPAILTAIAILAPIVTAYIQADEKRRTEEAKERRAEEWNRQRIRNSETLAVNREALREHQVGKWSNDVVVKDLQIEQLKLKNELLERELGRLKRWQPGDPDPDGPAPR